ARYKDSAGASDQSSRSAGYCVADRGRLGVTGAHYHGVTLALDPDGTNVNYAYDTPRRYLIQVQTANNYFLRIRVSGGRIWLSAQNGLNGPWNESNYVDLPTGVDNVEVKAYYAIRPGGEQDWLYFRVGDIVQGPVRVPDLGAGNSAYSST